MAAGSERTGIGARIRNARQKQGLTQEQLAELTGVTREYISRLENGRQGARADILVAIADRLGIDPGVMLRGMTAAEEDSFLVRETEEAVRRLVPYRRRMVLQFAEMLLAEEEGLQEESTK